MIRSLYLNNRFFIVVIAIIGLCCLGFAYPFFFTIAQVSLLVTGFLLIADILLLYRQKNGIKAKRSVPEKLSNGDDNPIDISLQNGYGFPVTIRMVDEVPFQFQLRDMDLRLTLQARENKQVRYTLRPVKRGEYQFGALNIFVSGIIGLVRRRYIFDQGESVPVYPSYLQMRKYELLAISDRLTEMGIKKIRRIGQNREFEQIKEYVQGDDIRTINWKATARRNNLMVNHYQDEKSQNVYSVIDKGRVMKMPFEGMSLVDYAINASLVLSNIAVLKEDKAGIITFNHNIGTVLPASRSNLQMKSILEVLYNQRTNFKESDYELLYTRIRRVITQRSLVILYTNFETLSSMERQLPFLVQIAKNHLLVVVFFENTELVEILEKPVFNTEEVYKQTIAQKFAFEKRQIVKVLQQHGIHAVLTPPQKLTVNTINKYLELKARGLI
ncbi:DUF58 domain-containing protein [Cytophagaceae bacterium DM2B3-1]|uniref:DUF58 domain-containing protein n=1 Tax=Xanthocytophaga flava TaxID=3048013 RepID=A0ABT7CQ60_9BACT|nr:DUF58 domain-containing protein [Xanthocytophaga flavus]MDJ1468806.1 DUF58 domain-containing protein [Xanthocytophaga flavus]MDJ1495666.1 DUF58 domain-containing protein [Xanthocytophaga flavus]